MRAYLNLIGSTPLIRLKRIQVPGKSDVRLFAKLEQFNPSGSLKDRIVKHIVKRAEKDGRLKSGMTIVEASSGNTGIALGMVCNLKGYACRVYMPESKSMERRIMIRAWGADLVLTDKGYQNSHIDAAEELCGRDPDKYFYFNQNGEIGNVEAHYEGTGKEIVKQMEGQSVDFFVAGFGTGGTLMGVARALRENYTLSKIVGVQPATALSRIEGLLHLDGSYVPPLWDDSCTDEMMSITDEEAMESTRRLALEEGIFAGVSSGANLAAALKIGDRLESGNIVFICGDRGERYLSTPLYDVYRG